jgi:hypothetical protein
MGLQKKHAGIGVGMVVFAVIVIGAVAGTRYFTQKSLSKDIMSDSDCSKYTQTNHLVVFKDGASIPAKVDATQCDSLTVTNLDTMQHLLAFGPHDAHITYDGISEKKLNEGDSITVTLVKTGTFLLHDHNNDKYQTTFTVVARK